MKKKNRLLHHEHSCGRTNGMKRKTKINIDAWNSEESHISKTFHILPIMIGTFTHACCNTKRPFQMIYIQCCCFSFFFLMKFAKSLVMISQSFSYFMMLTSQMSMTKQNFLILFINVRMHNIRKRRRRKNECIFLFSDLQYAVYKI